MLKVANIAVVGHGFVGKAVAHGFRGNNLTIIDPMLNTSTSDLITAAKSGARYNAVFICVPTPMGEDGTIDASIVAKVLEELKDLDTILVLKSTVIPDIVDGFSKIYKNFVYNPEFLTEANAGHDFENPSIHVFGGNIEFCEELDLIYVMHSQCKWCPSRFMSAKEASFAKYSINSFLALKVIFWNQMKTLMEENGADYDLVRSAFTEDPRIGKSHSAIPGHDGRMGTGSACFSKDIPAIIQYSKMTGQELSVLREAWNVNCDIRNAYGEVLPREKEQHITFNKI